MAKSDYNEQRRKVGAHAYAEGLRLVRQEGYDQRATVAAFLLSGILLAREFGVYDVHRILADIDESDFTDEGPPTDETAH